MSDRETHGRSMDGREGSGSQAREVAFAEGHWERASLVHRAQDPTAPCVYVTNMDAHPLVLAQITDGLDITVCSVFVRDWDDDLTPWPAPGLYHGDADFRGYADQSLQELTDTVIPRFEEAFGLQPRARAISGYSLGGLFSVYSFTKDERFAAAASMSGSFWFDGWLDYLRKWHEAGPDFHGERFVYLSLGDKEHKAQPPRLHCVEANTEETQQLLEESGVKAVFQKGPGGHFDHVAERMAAGLKALDLWFKGTSA